MKQERNRFRIIGGDWRGRVLRFPDAEGLRPTSDRVRETLFNWLREAIAGAACLDLFAGSGALALEALSRGAASVTALESSPAAAAALRANGRLLEAGRLSVAQRDALLWLGGEPDGPRFDIAFLDPPFAADYLARCCRLLEDGHWLAPRALVYLESGRPLESLVLPEGWTLEKSRKAGQVHYGLCRRDQDR